MIRNVLTDYFKTTLEREGKTVKLYNAATEFMVLFRHDKANGSKTTQLNDILIFYSIDTPIAIGMLLSFNGKVYIVVNQSTTENSVYKSSNCRECNKTVTLSRKINTGKEDENGEAIYETITYGVNIPCYKYTDTSKFQATNNGLLNQTIYYFILSNNFVKDSKRYFINTTDKITQTLEDGITTAAYRVESISDEVLTNQGGLYVVETIEDYS